MLWNTFKEILLSLLEEAIWPSGGVLQKKIKFAELTHGPALFLAKFLI